MLFLGIDAADWDDIDPLIEQGRLPNLSELKSRSAYGNQDSVAYTSPAIWTSIATGVMPEEHGILAFTVENPSYSPEEPSSKQYLPYSSTMRERKALWEYLSEQGKTVGIVGGVVTWPAEVVNGYMFSSYSTLDVNQGGVQLTGKGTFYTDGEQMVYPPNLVSGLLGERIRALADKGIQVGLETSETILHDYPNRKMKGRLIDETRWVFVADEVFFQIGCYMIKNYPTDFSAIYFAGADVIGHRFAGTAADAKVLASYYERLDEFVGRLVKEMPPNSTIVLGSDHGTAYPDMSHDYSGGVYLYAGPSIRPGRYSAKCDSLDFFPTIVALLDVPIPVDLPRRPLDFMFKPDWNEQHSVELAKVSLSREVQQAPGRSKHDEQILNRLKNLGYLESSGASKRLGPETR